MYTPSHTKITDRDAITSFIHSNAFGALITHANGALSATHLPFLYNPAIGQHGQLRAHWAKANPQWKALEGEDSASDALVIFTGPHTYISAGWYEHNDAISTWNYTAVHVTGPVSIIHDTDAKLAIIADTLAFYDPALLEVFNEPSMHERIRKNLAGVVGFSIDITNIEAKFKLSQNRTPTDQRRVIDSLRRERTDEQSLAVAKMIEELLG